MRVALVSLALALVVCPAASARTAAEPEPYAGIPAAPVTPVVHWRHSRAVGAPWAGRLVRGVMLPAEGPDWFTWDPVLNRRPNRAWRRWGTDTLVRTVLRVLHDYREDNP